MPEPGWYNDPRDPSLARWHDGQRYTEHTIVKADHASAPPPPPGMHPNPQPAFGSTMAPPMPGRGQYVDGARRQSKAWWKRWWAIALFVLVGLTAIGAAAGGGDDDEPTRTGNTVADEPAEEDDDDYTRPPMPSEIALDVVVLSQECFGSAGCNVTYDLDVAYTGPGLDEDGEWTLIYQVDGGEDGPQIGSMTLRGDGQVTYQGETFISTDNASTVLTATVTAVRP